MLVTASRRKPPVPVSATFTTFASDGSGRKVAVFRLRNDSKRLFVRGRSEIEIKGASSNQVAVLQITNVDYLIPKQTAAFSLPLPAGGRPWRLKFTYIGQFHKLEALTYEAGWSVYRSGVPIPVRALPRHRVYEAVTQWIDE
jgi:hypothetical protein